MKTLILIAYLVGSYLLVPYLFSYLGALKKVGALSADEINSDEPASEKLTEKEVEQAKKWSNIVFMILAMYLCALLGVVFGLASQELVGASSLKWVAYPFFYILMVSSFRMGRKVVEAYEIQLSIKEQMVFYLTMLWVYLWAILQKESLPFILTWYWIY